MREYILLSVLLLACGTLPAAAAEVQPGEIRSLGQATVYVMPDTARVQFSVIAEDKSLPTARQQAATAMEKVLGAVRDLKIEGLTMQTLAVQVSPLYEPVKGDGYYGDQTYRKVVAFRVTNSVSVKVKGEAEDLKKWVAQVIDGALVAGANTMNGPWFSKEDTSAAKREALEKATRDAMANAEAMARGLGVKITRYSYVSLTAPEPPRPMYEARNMLAAAAPGMGGGTASPIEIEAQPVEATVYVTAEY
jgi:uncharacterized protein YggE